MPYAVAANSAASVHLKFVSIRALQQAQVNNCKATQPTCLLRGSTTSTAMCPCLHVEPLFYNTAGSEDDKLPVIILRPHPAEGPVVKGGQGGLRWRRRAAIALLQLKFLAHAWVLLQLAHVHLHAKRNTAPFLSNVNSRSMQVRQIAEGRQAVCSSVPLRWSK